ncbi:hypothetical protein QUF90_04170 [Desulfococcaceae bacterium HSG9]|nr:hypothetical protein [Desulfococcaceae bacterium HSG9]
MNPPECNEYDYINFQTATPKVYTCTEAERVQPDYEKGPSHDSINRLLHRLPADAASLREESRLFIKQNEGVPGTGRFHSGLTVCSENRAGRASSVRKASPGCKRNQSGIFAPD